MTSPPARRAPLTTVVGTTMTHQVAFCGPIGVGKTTAVRAAATSEVASTEAQWSVTNTLVGRGAPKRTTTVGIDYAEWKGPHGTVALYGTPGQERFADARDGALSSHSKILLWLFGNSPNALAEADRWLDVLEADANANRITVAVTRLHEESSQTLDDFAEAIHPRYPEIKILEADPRDPDSVRHAVATAIGVNA